jgi:hypothetical protein
VFVYRMCSLTARMCSCTERVLLPVNFFIMYTRTGCVRLQNVFVYRMCSFRTCSLTARMCSFTERVLLPVNFFIMERSG